MGTRRVYLAGSRRACSLSSCFDHTIDPLAIGGEDRWIMNSHSLPPSHSHSSLHNDTIYSSTSHNYTRYYSTIPRPRPQNMSQHHPVIQTHTQNYSHSHQNASWAPSSSMVVPPVLQEVYILDCKSCDTFLTNRGMRVSRSSQTLLGGLSLVTYRLSFYSNPTFLYTPAMRFLSIVLRVLVPPNTLHLTKQTRLICLC